jgi:hypothetical protein
MNPNAKIAIVESQYAAEFAAVRAAHSELREADVQVERAGKRRDDAIRIYETAQKTASQKRLVVGLALLRVRPAWPERGPNAKGWGEYLKSEGINESNALRWMEEARASLGDEKISAKKGRLAETPHPAEIVGGNPAEQPDPPRKVFGLMADMPLYLGSWQDMLADIGVVDALVTDPPYSPRVHKSKPTRRDGVDPDGLAPDYGQWEPKDVNAFVEHWSPRVHGWMLCLCDDELIPAYRAAYERMGRVAFAPVPCVITGMSVRTRGDGPSSWAVYAMVARPTGGVYANWGTLPGAYVGPTQPGAGNGRGKPSWLTDAFVKDYSRLNDLVCDPLAGYGGTLISAISLKRRAIGAESDGIAVEEAFKRAALAAGG